MVHLEQVLILTDEKRKVFNNWQQVKNIYDARACVKNAFFF